MTKFTPKLLSSVYEAYNEALPGKKWAPRKMNGSLVTYCNEAFSFICKSMGYTKFDKPETPNPTDANLANQIFNAMSDYNGDWLSISGDVAQSHANQGALVAAAIKGSEHGHVCVVIPGELSYSASFGKLVPVVMNIGKDVFIGKRVSFAFQKEPFYYVLKSTI